MGQRRIKGESRKYFQLNENKNTTNQNLWDTADLVFNGKFIALSPLLNKKKSLVVNDLNFYLKLDKHKLNLK